MNDRAVTAVARYGLDDDAWALDVTSEEWRRAVPRLVKERLAGIAIDAESVGAMRIPAAVLEQLVEAHREQMMWALTLERALGPITDGLRRRGVDPVVLKGPVLAHTAYPDPSWRPFADLDLLVASSERALASRVLANMGFPPKRPAPRPGFDERFAKAVVHGVADGIEVDLHRTLSDGPLLAWIDEGLLMQRAQTFVADGMEARRLDDTCLFLHACIHAVAGDASPALLTLRDVAETWRLPQIDWTSAKTLARRWRLATLVGIAARRAAGELALTIPDEVEEVAAQPPSAAERWAVRSYGPRIRSRGAREVALFTVLPSVRDRAAYAGSLLVPSKEFLRARASANGASPSHRSRWRAALANLATSGEA